jgi:hypothetical protein
MTRKNKRSWYQSMYDNTLYFITGLFRDPQTGVLGRIHITCASADRDTADKPITVAKHVLHITGTVVDASPGFVGMRRARR